MLVFRKNLMLERLEQKKVLDKIDEKALSVIDEIDGKPVYRDDAYIIQNRKMRYYAITSKDQRVVIDSHDVEEKDCNKNKERSER